MCDRRWFLALLTGCTGTALLLAGGALAAPPAPDMAASQTQATAGDAEEKIDQRLQFLMDQLAEVEERINEIDKALLLTAAQQNANKAKIDASVKGTELMNRHAGGPVPWQEFYGKKPRNFFFRGRRTTTVVAGGGVVRWSSPAYRSKRPPQFNYIYKANEDVKKRAAQEIAALGQKADVLVKRRQQLEAEQIVLWCKIALRAVTVQELAAQPLYRFELKAENGDAAAAAHVEAVRAAVSFLCEANRLALAAPKEVEVNPARTFGTLEQAVASAREDMEERLLEQPALAQEASDAGKALGKFKALAQQLEDVATNTAEAYRSAEKYDRAGDGQQKNAMRAKFQQAVFGYAEALLAADECAGEMAEQWHVAWDSGKATTLAVAPQGADAQPAAPGREVVAKNGGEPEEERAGRLIEGTAEYQGHQYKVFSGRVGWKKANDACEAMGGHLACLETEAEHRFVMQLRGEKMVWVGGLQDAKGKWVWVNGQALSHEMTKSLEKMEARVARRGGEETRMQAYIAMGPKDSFQCRPETTLRVRGIMGYVCEWDNSAPAPSSPPNANTASDGASNGKQGSKKGKRHR